MDDTTSPIPKHRPWHAYIARLAREILPLLSYLFVALLMVYPVASADSVIGTNESLAYIWFLSWIRRSLLSGTWPFFTNAIYYPTGGSLLLNAASPMSAVFAIPILPLAGNWIATYNVLTVLSLALSGYSAHRLSLYMTHDLYGAYLAGVLFAFNPFMLGHALGHLALISAYGIPLYVLYLMKTVDGKTGTNSLYAAIALVLVTYAGCYQYLIFCVLFTAIYLVHKVVSLRKLGILPVAAALKTMTWKVAGIGVLFFLIASPALIPAIIMLIGDSAYYSYMTPTHATSLVFSADLLSYVIPPEWSVLSQGWVQALSARLVTQLAENSLFFGYTALALMAYALVKAKRGIGLWVMSLVVFLTLTLGPILRVNGATHFTRQEISIWLPYAALPYLPILRYVGEPTRFGVFVKLSAAMISAHSFLQISRDKFFTSERRRATVATFLIILILAEFAWIPFPSTKPDVPTIFSRMAKDREDYAFVIVPILLSGDSAKYMYYAAVAGKSLVGGYISGGGGNAAPAYFLTNPLMSRLYSIKTSSGVLDQSLPEVGSSILRYYHIRYIIVLPHLLSSQELDTVLKMMKEINASLVEQSDDAIVYTPGDQSQETPFMWLGENWQYVNWMWTKTFPESAEICNDARIYVVNPSNSTMHATLSFRARAYENTTLTLQLNQDQTYTMRTNQEWSYGSYGFLLRPGSNILILRASSSYAGAGLLSQSDDPYRCGQPAPVLFENIRLVSDGP